MTKEERPRHAGEIKMRIAWQKLGFHKSLPLLAGPRYNNPLP
jgi:hypothetical protein